MSKFTKMKRTVAIGIAQKMFDATCELWEHLRPIVGETFVAKGEYEDPEDDDNGLILIGQKLHMLEDYEYWYGISDDWDVNIWSGNDNILHCTLYEVDEEGNTISDYFYKINRDGTYEFVE